MTQIKTIGKYLALVLLSAIPSLYADDTETFLGSNAFAPDPKVLFIFDNSGSMERGVDHTTPYSRMSIAKKAFLDIVHDPANADLDMGLMLFNSNIDQSGDDSNHGGRVVFAIQDIDANNRGAQPDTYTHSNADVGDGSCAWNGSAPANDTLSRIICNITSTTNTPLEETLYEAYLYYRGINPIYGNQNRNSQITPLEDSDARKNSSYYSPLLEDPSFLKYDKDNNGTINIDDLSCERAYIVLMTDGSPWEDSDAHHRIKPLVSGITNPASECDTDVNWGQCMDELSQYMFQTDLDGDSSNDKQDIVTYTVGFTTNQSLLDRTATKGGGRYFTANNASQLQSAFESIFTSINDATTSFTSAGTGNSAANDARSLDYIYNAFLKPSSTPRWSGNLKKYRVDMAQIGFEADGVTPQLEFKIVDANERIVYDQNGRVISIANANTDENGQNYDVQSIWSATPDTDQVEAGGAGAAITDYSSRVVYTNADTDGNANTQDIFTNFNTGNVNLSNSLFNATNSSEKNTLVNWALGKDTDDENQNGITDETRWVMGDPLHSQPTVINYGKRQNIAAYSGEFSDIRIAIGTNAGFLHLFKDDLGGAANSTSNGHTTDDLVTESWAFIPKELLAIIKPLKTNSASTKHPYGLDSSISVYIDDKNQDSNICSATRDCNGDGNKDGDLNADNDTTDEGEGDDQVIIVFGMRRGGPYYYAIDVTDPDNPTFLWKYTHADIEQSWSEVEFGRVKYFDATTNSIEIKTVAIFSAGYDTNKDTLGAIGTNDDQGNGLFMLDLISGELIWSVLQGSGTSTATSRYEANLVDSIPATPKAVDINGDDILDRIYLADTGGNVWRLDLFNQDVSTAYDTNPNPTYDTRDPLGLYTKDSRLFWSIFKFANLGRGDQSGLANDRRFFNQIDFVQTRDDAGDFDAILLGSGHRNNPNEQDIANRFYMLKDLNTSSHKFQSSNCVSDTNNQAFDRFCKTFPSALTNTNLEDRTTSAPSSYTHNGWRIDLTDSGEKNLSSSVTINGTVLFTTYSPTINLSDPCSALGGNSFFYAINLHTSRASLDFNNNGTLEAIVDRKISTPQVGGGIPGDPGIIVPQGSDDIYANPGPKQYKVGGALTIINYWFKKSE